MSRIQEILNKAERDGTARRTRALSDQSGAAAVAAPPMAPAPHMTTPAFESPAAWTPTSLEDDGAMVWTPEPLDMSIATAEQDSSDSRDDLRDAGTTAPREKGFTGGDLPVLGVTHRFEIAKRPSAEQEPTISDIENGDE